MATGQLTDIKIGRIPIYGVGLARGSTATLDQRFLNGYFDVLKMPNNQNPRYFFTKRPGLAAYVDHSVTATGRAITSWKGHLYTVKTTRFWNGTDWNYNMPIKTNFDLVRRTRSIITQP